MSVAYGIHDLSVATGSRVLALDLLAEYSGIDPDKFRLGLGQERLSVLAPDEDIVTMAAAAALPIIERHGSDDIRAVLFATESGIDQSKSAAVFVHELLGLPRTCRVVEFKQACYGGTAALQAALGMVAREPGSRVLVIASDVARYALDSAAEATQGAAAVALLVSADPALVAVEPAAGVWTADIDDFWRPNDSDTALVDGRLSVDTYLAAVVGSWDDYRARGGVDVADIDLFCHHQPYTRMAHKALRALAAHTGTEIDEARVAPSTVYNRQIGNSYTASLFLSLAAVLDGDDDLTGRRVGLYSYGSGATGEFLAVSVQPGYRAHTRAAATLAALAARTPIDIATYRSLHAGATHRSAVDTEIAPASDGPFRFRGITGRARHYERV
ncbi:hydroxymethylglutaryl-CoA synthase [Microbacterium telephonicum]|uniref:Hydroxymethylglutaryl-CoA synthase n=1 Tax=Microbacterium telephonicum TaxID=1714841 RepID=A0A498C0Q4_9MICO|nr:hydroxymethylglutaryl-CoA synthase [Microbacterium telephonicum]RLK49192.1 hydroxymethylglutaryl-CoA synthase [Microbacterium telephonicum]